MEPVSKIHTKRLMTCSALHVARISTQGQLMLASVKADFQVCFTHFKCEIKQDGRTFIQFHFTLGKLNQGKYNF